jgi:ribosomal protein S18 acetylase RimI-like enzyme
MNIRPIKRDEVEGLLELWKEFMNDPSAIDVPIPTHAENITKQRGFITKMLEEDPGQVLVADASGELVGYVMFQSEIKPPLETEHKVGYVSDLYVKPNCRRQGIGRQLLLSCLERIKANGVNDIQLRVWSKNRSAIGLYRRLGFNDRMLTMQLSPQHEAGALKEYLDTNKKQIVDFMEEAIKRQIPTGDDPYTRLTRRLVEELPMEKDGRVGVTDRAHLELARAIFESMWCGWLSQAKANRGVYRKDWPDEFEEAIQDAIRIGRAYALERP